MKHSQKTSIWNAFIRRLAGTKELVIAMWQMGVPWAPSVEMLNSNHDGAAEHVAQHFGQWANQFARSVYYHKNHEQTLEAQRRSGQTRGQNGLTRQEQQYRESKRNATRDYHWAKKLHAEDQAAQDRWNYWRAAASQGKGKGNKRDHRGKHVESHYDAPRRYEDMQENEKWLVRNYRNNWLRQNVQEARSMCHPVEAPRYSVFRTYQDP